ncbi:hypothetical protein Purlil1_13555 [Purpureocillium lilacinum]|uniref:Uncharacterized protein n=1 Tax=Purpureocillium lilacinum TaxID=33203 RepID=A0ABR0BDS4_PURLI|nr:hypothetical protein Purlil1_13555 [Purpureocillium lilacinum]
MEPDTPCSLQVAVPSVPALGHCEVPPTNLERRVCNCHVQYRPSQQLGTSESEGLSTSWGPGEHEEVPIAAMPRHIVYDSQEIASVTAMTIDLVQQLYDVALPQVEHFAAEVTTSAPIMTPHGTYPTTYGFHDSPTGYEAQSSKEPPQTVSSSKLTSPRQDATSEWCQYASQKTEHLPTSAWTCPRIGPHEIPAYVAMVMSEDRAANPPRRIALGHNLHVPSCFEFAAMESIMTIQPLRLTHRSPASGTNMFEFIRQEDDTEPCGQRPDDVPNLLGGGPHEIPQASEPNPGAPPGPCALNESPHTVLRSIATDESQICGMLQQTDWNVLPRENVLKVVDTLHTASLMIDDIKNTRLRSLSVIVLHSSSSHSRIKHTILPKVLCSFAWIFELAMGGDGPLAFVMIVCLLTLTQGLIGLHPHDWRRYGGDKARNVLEARARFGSQQCLWRHARCAVRSSVYLAQVTHLCVETVFAEGVDGAPRATRVVPEAIALCGGLLSPNTQRTTATEHNSIITSFKNTLKMSHHHPDYQSGLSDEAAVETHDLIQHAEEEEEAMHAHDKTAAPKKGQSATGGLGEAPGSKTQSSEKESKVDKICATAVEHPTRPVSDNWVNWVHLWYQSIDENYLEELELNTRQSALWLDERAAIVVRLGYCQYALGRNGFSLPQRRRDDCKESHGGLSRTDAGAPAGHSVCIEKTSSQPRPHSAAPLGHSTSCETDGVLAARKAAMS